MAFHGSIAPEALLQDLPADGLGEFRAPQRLQWLYVESRPVVILPSGIERQRDRYHHRGCAIAWANTSVRYQFLAASPSCTCIVHFILSCQLTIDSIRREPSLPDLLLKASASPFLEIVPFLAGWRHLWDLLLVCSLYSHPQAYQCRVQRVSCSCLPCC